MSAQLPLRGRHEMMVTTAALMVTGPATDQ